MAKSTLNLDDLLTSTKTNFPNRFSHAVQTMPQVPRLIYTPFVGVKTLSVRAEVQGASENKVYKVIILFTGVDYSATQDTKHPIKIKVTGKKYVWMAPITLRHKVSASCGCLDFYFAFAHWNWKAGALYGKKRKQYIRKTTTRPEVNPNHVPGLCKHLIAVWQKVKRSKYFK